MSYHTLVKDSYTQLPSASGLIFLVRLGSNGKGGPFCTILVRNVSGLASAVMNFTKAVLFSSSVNLKLSTYEYACAKLFKTQLTDYTKI